MVRKPNLAETEHRDAATGHGMARSPKWPGVEKLHLKFHPVCEACASSKNLNVHHKKPFHLFPQLELDMNNLITLCMDKECHIKIGHGDNFKDYNPDVETDAQRVRVDISLFESVAEEAKNKRLIA
jgi:hypothetical protein